MAIITLTVAFKIISNKDITYKDNKIVDIKGIEIKNKKIILKRKLYASNNSQKLKPIVKKTLTEGWGKYLEDIGKNFL